MHFLKSSRFTGITGKREPGDSSRSSPAVLGEEVFFDENGDGPGRSVPESVSLRSTPSSRFQIRYIEPAGYRRRSGTSVAVRASRHVEHGKVEFEHRLDAVLCRSTSATSDRSSSLLQRGVSTRAYQGDLACSTEPVGSSFAVFRNTRTTNDAAGNAIRAAMRSSSTRRPVSLARPALHRTTIKQVR